MLGKAIQRLTKSQVEIPNIVYHFIGSMYNLCDKRTCEELFYRLKPTHVIHLAAHVGGMFENRANNVDFFLKNIEMNNNVLTHSQQANIQRVVSCLSTCVFPDGLSNLNETNLHQGPPHQSNAGYAYAKRMLHVLGQLLNEQHGKTTFTCVTPCNLYGPYDKSTHVIPDLIKRFINAKQQQHSQVTIKGTGSAKRQFLHVDDLAKVILDQLWRPDPIEHVVVASRDELTIKQIVSFLSDHYHINYEFEGTTKDDGQLNKYANTSVLQQLYPDFKIQDFWTGLAQICQHMEKEAS